MFNISHNETSYMYAQMQHEFQVILMGGAINTIQCKYFVGYKFCRFVKILILRKKFSRWCLFIFVEITFVLCRETAKSAKIIASKYLCYTVNLTTIHYISSDHKYENNYVLIISTM